jgi:hypothetical protein
MVVISPAIIIGNTKKKMPVPESPGAVGTTSTMAGGASP